MDSRLNQKKTEVMLEGGKRSFLLPKSRCGKRDGFGIPTLTLRPHFPDVGSKAH